MRVRNVTWQRLQCFNIDMLAKSSTINVRCRVYICDKKAYFTDLLNYQSFIMCVVLCPFALINLRKLSKHSFRWLQLNNFLFEISPCKVIMELILSLHLTTSVSCTIQTQAIPFSWVFNAAYKTVHNWGSLMSNTLCISNLEITF